MTKLFVVISLLSVAFTPAFARLMPCDAGYTCKSESGRYEIQLQHCRYTNDLHLLNVRVGGKEIENAKLHAGYDGLSVGGNILAFDIDIPTEDDSSQSLSVEQIGNKGTILSRYADEMPAPTKVVRQEAISCETGE